MLDLFVGVVLGLKLVPKFKDIILLVKFSAGMEFRRIDPW
jgi:hypothetical protein